MHTHTGGNQCVYAHTYKRQSMCICTHTQAAIKDAGIKAQDIDLVIVATSSPDDMFGDAPSVASGVCLSVLHGYVGVGYSGLFCRYVGLFCGMYRALWRIYRALVQMYRALLRIYRSGFVVQRYIEAVWSSKDVFGDTPSVASGVCVGYIGLFCRYA